MPLPEKGESRIPLMLAGALYLFLLPVVSPSAAVESGEGLAALLVTVEDSAGTPIPDAQVFLLGKAPGVEEHPFESRDGWHRFETPHAGNRTLIVFAPDHYRAEISVTLHDGLAKNHTVSLSPYGPSVDMVLQVTTGNEEARPLPAAQAIVLWNGMDASGQVQRVEHRVQTDNAGQALVTLPGNGTIFTHASHDFFQPSSLSREVRGEQHIIVEHLLDLEPGHRWIRGSVVDAATGEPIQESNVRLHLPIGFSNRVQWIETRTRATTDANGAFQLPMPQGQAQIVVSLDGWFNQTAQVATDGNTPLEIRLERSPPRNVTVTGQVIDSETSTPIQGVAVESIAWAGTHQLRSNARTDDQGTFELIVPEIPQKVFFSCMDACFPDQPPRSIATRIQPQGDRVSLGTVPLSPDPLADGEHVSGIVVETGGTPLSGAVAIVYDAVRERVLANSTTDGEGRFHIPTAQGDGEFWLVVRGPGAPPDLSGLAHPTGYRPIVTTHPNEQRDLGEIVLEARPSFETILTFDLSDGWLDIELQMTLGEAGPLLGRLVADAVLGDGDGNVSVPELDRLAGFVEALGVHSLPDIEVFWDGVPIRVQADGLNPRLEVRSGGLWLIDSGVAALWPVEGAARLGLSWPEPQWSTTHVSVRWSRAWSVAEMVDDDEHVLAGTSAQWTSIPEQNEPQRGRVVLVVAPAVNGGDVGVGSTPTPVLLVALLVGTLAARSVLRRRGG